MILYLYYKCKCYAIMVECRVTTVKLPGMNNKPM